MSAAWPPVCSSRPRRPRTATSTLARLERLERALDDGGGPHCPVCTARLRITGPWTTEREPAQCPRCGAAWEREAFTIDVMRPRAWHADDALGTAAHCPLHAQIPDYAQHDEHFYASRKEQYPIRHASPSALPPAILARGAGGVGRLREEGLHLHAATSLSCCSWSYILPPIRPPGTARCYLSAARAGPGPS